MAVDVSISLKFEKLIRLIGTGIDTDFLTWKGIEVAATMKSARFLPIILALIILYKNS